MDTSTMTCVRCGTVGLQQGFLSDSQSGGMRLYQNLHRAMWVWGGKRSVLEALRCPRCGHVELFAYAPG